jgi:hypothetical protein
MQRFFFHVLDNGRMILDEEGIELADLDAARDEATKSVRWMLGEAIKAGKLTVPDAFVIADESGRTLDTIPLATALPHSLRGKVPATARLGGPP